MARASGSAYLGGLGTDHAGDGGRVATRLRPAATARFDREHTMTIRDSLGLAHSGAGAAGLDRYGTALHQLNCYVGDPVAAADAALEASPGFTMAHVLKAYLFLLSTEATALPVALGHLEQAGGLAADERERGHLAAARLLAQDRWHEAGRVLEDVSIAWPRDLLALQAGHLVDFFTGQSRMLRDRVARALPAWDAAMPGYHAVLGMHAFGLEETGEYGRAEAAGRRSVELEPRDGWGQHAVAHVLEMQCRQADGIAWMRGNAEAWSKDSFFQVHNWWHLALYHLELGEIEAVLGLFDGPIYRARSRIVLDMVDASALLWRLHLRGIDVGDRWQPVAEAWAVVADAGNYAFNDAHAMMAFVGAGRPDDAARVLAAQERAAAGDGDNAVFTAEVGRPLTRAIAAFGAGDYAAAVEPIRRVRGVAHRFGGSHAQRDLFDLTLLEAAIRAGDRSLAGALAAERNGVRLDTPLSRLFLQRAGALAAA